MCTVHAGSSAKEIPPMTTPRPAKARSEGQWALGKREPLNPTEELKKP
jgi:sulfite reductase (ferredoxin)